MKADRPKAATYQIAWTGPMADVRMQPDVFLQYNEAIEGNDEISTKRKVHLQRYFTEFCNSEDWHKRLSDRKFKREGNFRDGKGGWVAVWTFKGWQWRLYGAILKVVGRRCFVAVEVDPEKKQDRADQRKLKATAKAVAELLEYEA